MKKRVWQNKKLWFFFIFLFLTGILTGSILGACSGKNTVGEITDFFNHFFSVYSVQGTSGHNAFCLSALNYGTVACWFWLSGWHPFLLPIGLIQTALKGIRCGFTMTLLSRCFGWKGILFSFFAILPATLILLFAFCFYMTYQIQFAYDRNTIKKGQVSLPFKRHVYIRHILTTLIFLFLLLFASFTEGYLVPVLTQPLVQLFL
ncbi:MAG: stage II sporulation protein M [Clostridia bacterium]|nr:stage II sporulation protein M [Clostridia bacterium]